METLPVYSVDLVKNLDQMYPHKHPTLEMTDRDIWFKAGQRSVVDSLITKIQTGDDQELPSILKKD
jgi:molybdopterin converting factor small subunit